MWDKVKLSKVLEHRKEFVTIDDFNEYKRCRVQTKAQGIVLRDSVLGMEIKTKKQQLCKVDDFLVAEIDAKVGGYGIVPKELENAIVSSHYFLFKVKNDILLPEFLDYFSKTPYFFEQVKAQGSTNYAAIRPAQVLSYEIPLPQIKEQKRIVEKLDAVKSRIDEAKRLRADIKVNMRILFQGFLKEIFQSIERNSEFVLEDVCDVIMGQSPSGTSYNEFGEGLPLLNGPTEFGERYPIEKQWTSAPTKLCKKDDILICVRGATTGRMNWADKEYCIGRGLAAIRAKLDLCLPDYLYRFLYYSTQELMALTAGSTFPNLPGAKLKKINIPVPSLQIQTEIVNKINSFEKDFEESMNSQTKSYKELESLFPNVLEKAFRGEL